MREMLIIIGFLKRNTIVLVSNIKVLYHFYPVILWSRKLTNFLRMLRTKARKITLTSIYDVCYQKLSYHYCHKGRTLSCQISLSIANYCYQ